MGITKSELSDLVYNAVRRTYGGPAPGSGFNPGMLSYKDNSGGLLKPQNKTYSKMFPEESLDDDGFESLDQFLMAAYEGRDARLKTLSEGTDSAGGFSIPVEYAAMMLDESLGQEIIRPRCQVWPMKSNERKIPALEIGSHASHLYGGVVGGWISEGGTMTAHEPKFRQMTLITKKLYTYAVSTTEIFEDGASFEETLGKVLTLGLGWYLDYYLINGTGAGQTLGIKNCPCAVEVTKETGQPADSVVAENVFKMQQALHASCWQNAIFLAHPTTYVELRKLSLPIGTGGNALPLLTKEGNQFSLADMPLFFTEKVEGVLGDAADLILCDPTQYAVGIRKGLRLEKSNAPHFSSDKIDLRCLLRIDGQSLWDEALTLKDGSTEVSCIVTLGERT